MAGLSGFDTLLALKKFCPELPVIMITAQDSQKTYQESMRLGAEDYLMKPVSKERLMRSLDNVLARQETENVESKWLDGLKRLKKGTEKLREKVYSKSKKLYAKKIEIFMQTVVSLIVEVLEVLKSEYPDAGFATDYTSHNMRDTFISICVKSNVNLKTVMIWAGLKKFETLEHYIDLDDDFYEAEMKKTIKPQ